LFLDFNFSCVGVSSFDPEQEHAESHDDIKDSPLLQQIFHAVIKGVEDNQANVDN